MYKIKIIVIVFSALAILWLTGQFFDHRYKKKWQGMYFDKTDACMVTKNNYDVLFLGDSRVSFGINPYYYDSTSGLNSFNLGYAGADSKLMKLFADTYLENHTPPKAIFINVDEYTVVPSDALKESYFLLYYLKNDSVVNVMGDEGFHTSLIKLMPFTKYCFFNEYNRVSLIAPNLRSASSYFDSTSYKGFTAINPLLTAMPPEKDNDKLNVNEQFNINDTSISYLCSMIKRIKDLNIKVFLFYPPAKTALSSFDQIKKRKSIETGYRIARMYSLPYLRFDTSKIFKDDLFHDVYHLNKQGATIFSRLLGKMTDSLIKEGKK